jgi:hypothetical protein|tara:strand:- start:247 stop:435 length:189 start_codon:yes stop_codon:yes gene_type:complete
MVTLEQTLEDNYHWSIDRIHYLCEKNIDDAHAIQKEFSEWLNPNINDHDVFSLEYIGDDFFD